MMIDYLVEVVVDASSIDALGEESLHGIPWHLVRGQVGAALEITMHITISFHNVTFLKNI